MSERLLLVFVRAPKLGQVKTRLARTLGNEKALHIYERLLRITHAAASGVQATKWVCYADEIPEEDLWSAGGFLKKQQPQNVDLGVRMQTLFAKSLTEGYSPVVVIGSDCPAISPELLEEAYQNLKEHDVVMGPAQDGGYYLLGLKFLVPELLQDIPWSTSDVLESTVAAATRLNLTIGYLPVLSDVDKEEDLLLWTDLLA